MRITQNRRQRQHKATIDEIKMVAREQIAENGASNLSLGAIARAMGMTTPALYRYFDSRDALVAALVIDTYNEMGKVMEQALIDNTGNDYAEQFLALMHAYRQWAVDQPEAFALMYSTSTDAVTMSEMQSQQFQHAVLRSMGAMVQVLNAAQRDGHLTIPFAYQNPPPSMHSALIWMRSALQDESIPLDVLALALTTWLRADGLVWQELHGHLPKALFGEGDFYAMECRVLAHSLGLNAKDETGG